MAARSTGLWGWISNLRSSSDQRKLALQRRRQLRAKLALETLEERRVLAIGTPVFDMMTGTLTFTSDAAGDKLVLESTATPGTVNYDDGVGFGSDTQTGVNSIVYHGNGGDDHLVLFIAGGNLFKPASGMTMNITFNGGSHSSGDLLEAGGGAAGFTGTYVPSGVDAGTITYLAGGFSVPVTFTGLERIDDSTNLDSMTTTTSGGADSIHVVDGPNLPIVGGFQQGPVVVDGGDRDDLGHGSNDGMNNLNGWKYIEQMLDYALAESFNPAPTKDLLVIGSNSGQSLAATQSVVGPLGLNLSPGLVDYITTVGDISSVDFMNYKAFYVPSDGGQTSGGITQAQKDALATRTTAITDFVRAGGGLVALTENGLTGAYSWLSIGDPFTIGSFSTTIQRQTTYLADAFFDAGLQITNAELSAGTPTHNTFTGPAGFNGLDPWVVFPGADSLVDPANGGEYSPSPHIPSMTIVNGTPGTDRITTIGQGALDNTIGGGQSMQINDGGTNSFVSINLAHKVAVNVNGAGGGDNVRVNLSTAAKAVDLTTIGIDGGSGNDTVNVWSTPAMVITTANGGDNDDIVNIGSSGNSLDDIAGPVTANGQDGTDTLNVNDQGDASANTYDLNATTIVRVGAAPITYATFETVVLNATNDNDTINIIGSTAQPSTNTIVNGNNGDDLFVFSDNAVVYGAGSRLNGGVGEDKIDYTAYTTSRSIHLTALGQIDGYDGYEDDWTSGARFTDIDLLDGSANAEDANDFLYGPDLNNDWFLTGDNAGKIQEVIGSTVGSCEGSLGGPVSTDDPQDLDFTSIENVRGGMAQDWFYVGTGFSLSGSLGGRGNDPAAPDTLDYTAWSTAVSVDLVVEVASSIAGGLADGAGLDVGSSIENVLGGSGDDYLRGDVDLNKLRGYAGADTLNGRGGVDDLDGGAGNDTIEVSGSEAEFDVLVGGIGESLDPTDHDTMQNVGAVTVVLNGFNTSYADFSNSIDAYDGNGQALSGNGGVNLLHLGMTVVTNTTSVLGMAGNDQVTTSNSNNAGGSPVTYDGGAGTGDQVTLTFGVDQFQDFTTADILEIRAYLIDAPINPAAMLDLSDNNANLIAQGFENVDVAVYDDGQVVVITNCFVGITNINQIQFGTSGNDAITGTSAADLIFGLDGNDTIDGLVGNDCLFGGAGNDTIHGRQHADVIAGGSGDDTLYGEEDADHILGGSGIDTIYGGLWNDLLEGNSGNDTIYGGEDWDTVEGGSGNDTIYGELGNDILRGGAGDDTLTGADGDDTLDGGPDLDTLDGGFGNDDVQVRGAEAEFDAIQGGTGSDKLTNVGGAATPVVLNGFDGKTNGIEYVYANGALVTGNSVANTLDFRRNVAATVFVDLYNVAAILGCQGNDLIHGGTGADTIRGNFDDDTLFGYAGNDSMFGNNGNDTIYGGNDADTIDGGDGVDTIFGELGNDVLKGGAGGDILTGADGDDTLDGGPGPDTIDGGVGNDDLQTQANESENDSIQGGAGSDKLTNIGGAATPVVLANFFGITNGIEYVYANGAIIKGNDNPNTLDFRANLAATAFTTLFNMTSIQGAAGDDTIYGTNGANTIFGDAGNDTLYGYGGNDVLNGGDDADTIRGGNDADTVDGGNGADFIYGELGNDVLNGGADNDTISGADGDDTLNGGAGTDSIDGGSGNDDVRTQAAEAEFDTIQGGAGFDKLTNIGGVVAVVLNGFAGITNGLEYVYANLAIIMGNGGANVLDFRRDAAATTFVALFNVASIRGGAGNDTIHGATSADTIYGEGDNDSLFGYSGDDFLDGGDGNDTINGGAGFDTIIGGLGLDTLTGGANVDTFRFVYSLADTAELDTITDFSGDTIALVGYLAQGTTYATMTFAANTLSVNPTAKKIKLTGVVSKPAAGQFLIT